MIINRLLLKNFGKFQKKEIILKEGINVIYGENESGKSTLHSFLQGIFFGIRRLRGRASKTDAYSRYMPWENPNWYQGSVTFTCGEKTFRLERSFEKNAESVLLFCETDGELLSVEDGDLEMLLGNISESVYQNTVSVGQAKNRTEEGLYRELRDYLADFQGSGDLRFNPDKAQQILKEKQKKWEKKEKEALAKKETQAQEILYRIRHEEEEIEAVKNRLAELERLERAETEKRAEDTEDRRNRKQRDTTVENRRKILGKWLLYGVTVVLTVTGSIYFKVWWLSPLLVALLAWLFFGKRKKATSTLVWEAPVLSRKEKIREQKKVLVENLEERKVRLANLEEEYRESTEDNREILEIRKEIRCIVMAGNKLREAAAGMQKLTGGILQRKMSEILNEITEGKYRQVILDGDFQIRLDTGEKCLELYQVSYGTAEQVYFALRMACIDLLCREEELPLILDETFAMYDDKRLLQTLQWISRRKSQVILFSCNKREIRTLEKLHLPFHRVEL